MQFALGTDGDLVVENGRLKLISGIDATAQRIRTRLLTFRGEWELDRRLGVPHFERILVKPFNLRVVANTLRRVILETDGVERITEFNFDFDSTERRLIVNLSVQSADGEVSLSFNEVLL